MTRVAAHDLTAIRICKTPGCENEQRHPFIERGPYAMLCDEHYQAMRQKMSHATRERITQQWNGGSEETARPESYAARARSLVALGRKVDAALGHAAKAKRNCEPAIRKARDAQAAAEALAEQFRAAVRELAA